MATGERVLCARDGRCDARRAELDDALRRDCSLQFEISNLRSRFAQSRRMALAVGWKQSGKVLQAALEFGSFLFVQRLVLERL